MFIFLLAKKGVETHPLAEFFNFFFPFFLTLLKFIYDDIDSVTTMTNHPNADLVLSHPASIVSQQTPHTYRVTHM